jgi:SAM-dependent methyltransferase
MTKIEANITRNQRNYDNVYSKLDLGDLRKKIENYEGFLSVATKTDAGWVGLYHGEFKKKVNGQKVLELGCGKGLNALIMAALGAEVVAIDISEESSQMINRLSQELGLSSRVEAYSCDFRHLSFPPRSFDFVVGQAFLHHLVRELEDVALCQISQILKSHGEARFVEPAVNSKFLDQIRWLIPVRGRPSILQKKAFSIWKDGDCHPERVHSSDHYLKAGRKYFEEIEIVPYGGIDRLYRFFPRTELTRRLRRLAFKLEKRIPRTLNMRIARAQTIIYRKPRI